jgi:hypothetical protein
MGSQCRKPLWKKKALLDQESDLTVYVIKLNSFDIGEQAAQWSARAKNIIGQAYKWLTRLLRLKGCPDTVKTSFSGFRADLHQGYLTLDLVLLGPNVFGAAAYLRAYSEQATEREVDIEVIPCYSTDEVINVFGNLLSSMVIYSTHEECQALMVAFKGRRLIQSRGRFQEDHAKEGCQEVSNIPEEEVLETSQHPPITEILSHTGGGGTTNNSKQHYQHHQPQPHLHQQHQQQQHHQ